MPGQAHASQCGVILILVAAVRATISSRIAAITLLVLSHTSLAQAAKIVIRPREISDVLVNPGMGITTFQRFNGDPLNAGTTWSEAGPTAPLSASSVKPDFPDTSVAYCRWFWSALEPERGSYRCDIIDTALHHARAHHQTLAIRMMPYDQRHPLPEWYRNSGARRANKPADDDGEIWQPDFSDPLYLKQWGALVAMAGQRYDGHPDLDSVDISSVGYWGEGWSKYMPAFEHQKALIDIYLKAFRRTPLLMNFDEPDALAYGTSQGAGWRFDCLGDLRPKWSHMLDFYPEQIARTGIQEVWRRSPVSMETCGVPLGWKQKGWDVRYILSEALRWHVSTLNVKSSAIPPEWKGEFDDFQRKMGYRFALRRVEYDDHARAGAMLPLSAWWVNEGVAPVYRPYVLAYRFHSQRGEVIVHTTAVVRTTADLRKWLPGDVVFEESLAVPADLTPGQYELQVALLDPRTGAPAIRLAIEGRATDGWYSLGTLQIER
jgi:hypothetical protein